MNSNHPTKSSLSEADSAEMEEYNLRLLMSAMGHKFLEPPVSKEEVRDGVRYHITSSRLDIDAEGLAVPDGFVVQRGSQVSSKVGESFRNKSYYRLRANMESNGTIVDGIFTKDCRFKSCSAASSVIQDCSSYGWIEWKTEDGRTLRWMTGPEQTSSRARVTQVREVVSLRADFVSLNI